MSNPEMNINEKPQKPPQKKINTSGKGPSAPVPNAVKGKFNWGAFFFCDIWGIVNKKYIGIAGFFFMFIPIIGLLLRLILAIYMGIKGNEWAWQNNYYPSVGAFHESQQRWAHATIFYIVMIIISIIFTFLFYASILAMFLNFGGANSAAMMPPPSM